MSMFKNYYGLENITESSRILYVHNLGLPYLYVADKAKI